MRRGFSLVELSIVLVILGLLTGGILAGQSLIRASELRAISTEFSRYVTATQTFRDKYFAIPGDFSQATAFWGTAPSGCPGTDATPATDARTCDGNGNGLITSGASFEAYRYWQHLANAGLIEGTYTGVSASAANTYSSTVGVNVPRSKLGNTGYTVWYRDSTNAGSVHEFAGEHGNLYFFGVAGANGTTSFAALKPEEAWNIDTKIDDGRAGRGTVNSYRNSTCTDASSETDYDAEYLLTSNTIACGLLFRKVF